MKTALALALSLFATPAIADELDDAIAICVPHMHHTAPSVGPLTSSTLDLGNPDAGWEHCTVIITARNKRWEARNEEARKARELDEAQNPDLKKTRDLAQKLKEEENAPQKPGNFVAPAVVPGPGAGNAAAPAAIGGSWNGAPIPSPQPSPSRPRSPAVH
jgi:hypothetical protein